MYCLKKLLIIALFLPYAAECMQIRAWARKPIQEIMSALGGHKDGTAEFAIGLKWYEGLGVEQNFDAALKYFLKSAEKDHPEALSSLSKMYAQAEGVPKDIHKAIEYEKKAAELGYAFSQYNYGTMLENGLLGSKRHKEAMEWLKKAAAQGFGQALATLGVYARDGLDDSENQIEPDYQKAFELFKQAADAGSYLGIFNLAQLYQSGLGVKKNKAEAQKFFDQILKSEDKNSFNHKALMYEMGSGVARNLIEAKRYYIICAENPLDLVAHKGLKRVNKKIEKQEEIARELLAETGKTGAAIAEKSVQKAESSSCSSQENAPAIETPKAETAPSKQALNAELYDQDLAAILNNKLSYSDNSLITRIDGRNRQIIISNPDKKYQVTISVDKEIPLSPQKLKAIKKFHYDSQKSPKRTNVKDWLELPTDELLKKHTPEEMERHRFAQRVDEIIQCYGNDAYFVKQDGTLIENKVLEGTIKTNNNKTLKGTFEYSYYRDNSGRKVLYHRFLHPHSRAFA